MKERMFYNKRLSSAAKLHTYKVNAWHASVHTTKFPMHHRVEVNNLFSTISTCPHSLSTLSLPP